MCACILQPQVDVTWPADKIAAALAAFNPDVVVNCAAIAALGRCESEPEVATAVNCPVRLVDALASLAPAVPHFVHLCTDIVYDGVDPPYSEESRASTQLNVVRMCVRNCVCLCAHVHVCVCVGVAVYAGAC